MVRGKSCYPRRTAASRVAISRWIARLAARFTCAVELPSLATSHGELSEWLKVPDSKSGVAQATGGSNPSLSARGSTASWRRRARCSQHVCSQQQRNTAPERCPSGLRCSPGKRVYVKSVPRVRIPLSPPRRLLCETKRRARARARLTRTRPLVGKVGGNGGGENPARSERKQRYCQSRVPPTLPTSGRFSF